MTIITTVKNLRTWVDEHFQGNREERDHIAEAIRAGEHPRWGTDWTEFLADLPDNLHELCGDPEVDQ